MKMLSSCRLSINCVQVICKRFAGHSKWQNIRHTKASKDTEKSLLYTKLGQRIRLAVLESGSSDPVLNQKLSQAVEVARSKHMPSNTIQSYINQAQKSSTNAKSVWFEMRGPNGTFFIVQALTENTKRTRDLVVNSIKKHRLTLENNLKNQFIHKGIINVMPKEDSNEDVLVEHAIETGAEDVETIADENKIQFLCNPDHVKSVSEKIKKLGYVILDADEYYIPISTVNIDDALMEDFSRAIEKLNNMPEVINIYDNIA